MAVFKVMIGSRYDMSDNRTENCRLMSMVDRGDLRSKLGEEG